ncbi:MAG: DHH family phosphoesterase [Proteobacteria bacterium]|nr:DHH family phosphoesterase [Pseudomonadota bacterium]
MPNYVTTYVNPDLDGIACMIAVAAFMSRDGEKWEAVRFGKLDAESQFVLEKLDLTPPRQISDLNDADKIILVDTHHVSQLAENFLLARVVKIIDHHPNGNDGAFPNAEIINETIGAAASIVAKMYLDENIWNDKMLRLLAFAIKSNTSDFKEAITSDFDRKIYAEIMDRYPIPERDIENMLMSRTRVLEEGLRAAIESDVKIFDTKYGRVGISQLKMPGLIPAINVNRAVMEMAAIAKDMGVKYFALNAGDLDRWQSMVITANADTSELMSEHFGVEFENNRYLFDTILIRKRDFVF